MPAGLTGADAIANFFYLGPITYVYRQDSRNACVHFYSSQTTGMRYEIATSCTK